ncbi:MAG TPA: hypothetical protein VEK08_17000 [Planctomycetota bacterium]|nr:hypothetical protein [Planctomycetota bacterium]
MRLIAGCVFAALAALLVSGAGVYAGESKAPKKDSLLVAEEKEAQAEDEAEAKLDPETIQRRFEGKLALYPEADPANPIIVGTFSVGTNVYLLKVADAQQVTRLRQYSGKVVTLVGKIRNSGKYFIYSDVIEGGAAPIYVRRRGGI